jgi:hypothetical protein
VITRARQSGQAPTATTAPATTAPPVVYEQLSSAITRALRLTREAGDALTTAGQTLTGLSGALAEVVTAVAAMPELAAVSREASEI